MTSTQYFQYRASDQEAESASNSYLMSMVALIAGLPLPIVNLLATFFFYMGNRKGTYFVRWHCTQALLSQASLLIMNSCGFWWTIHIIFFDDVLSTKYIAYIFTVFLFNLVEFIVTIYSAVQVRKGNHVQWWFYGDLANLICKA